MPEQQPPTIRGENPPPSKVIEIQNFKEECRRFDTIEYVSIGTLATLGILTAFVSTAAPLLIFGVAGFVWREFNKKRKELEKKAIVANEPIVLFANNIEFTTPLADYTLFSVSVHFQTPTNFKYNDQLHRATENLLMNYSLRLKEPPDKDAIADYLRLNLVQFQNENDLSVLRLNVPLAFRVTPDKPKGGSIHV